MQEFVSVVAHLLEERRPARVDRTGVLEVGGIKLADENGICAG
jgi:hypothetical protein